MRAEKRHRKRDLLKARIIAAILIAAILIIVLLINMRHAARQYKSPENLSTKPKGNYSAMGALEYVTSWKGTDEQGYIYHIPDLSADLPDAIEISATCKDPDTSIDVTMNGAPMGGRPRCGEKTRINITRDLLLEGNNTLIVSWDRDGLDFSFIFRVCQEKA